jgi:hypothetical protein
MPAEKDRLTGENRPVKNTGALHLSLNTAQGIGVYFLNPENYQEIQEFNHKPHQRHELSVPDV